MNWQIIHLNRSITMTRLYLIIALGISALLFAWMMWFSETPVDKLPTNRTDLFGLSGKAMIDSNDWKFVPCNGTTPKCGRLE